MHDGEVNGKILVVDDEWPMRELLRIKLSKVGYSVITAKNGEEFRRCAFDEKPDLIILDIWLGKEGGGPMIYDDLVNRGFDRTIPVIFISALVEKDSPPRRAPKGGRFALYGKPFDFDLILKDVQQMLKDRQMPSFKRITESQKKNGE